MDPLQQLQKELDHWKEKCDQAKRQKTKKHLEKEEASDIMEATEKELDFLKQEVKKTEMTARVNQTVYQDELLKLQKKNDDMKEVVSNFQQRLDKSKEAFRQVQANLQVKDQLPFTNINFVKEASEDQRVDGSSDISYTCQIIAGRPYVLDAGQALLTFEDEQVARSIISKGRHAVDMESTKVNLKAYDPPLERYAKFELKMNISNKKIRVSNLPPRFPEEILKDKVELAFYKSANGGGEIEEVDCDPENNSAYVTYLQSGVPQRVLKARNHRIIADGTSYNVKVDPCIDVELDKLQRFTSISKRSVLLTGIRNIDEDEDTIQDLLQIHFQKTSSGGGEVEAIAFSGAEPKMFIFQEDLTDAQTST